MTDLFLFTFGFMSSYWGIKQVESMPWLGYVVVSLLLQRPRFNTSPFHVRFWVDNHSLFLSVSFHQCRDSCMSLTLYNIRNQWHCQRTSLKNMEGWCRGHILDMYSGWTWLRQWVPWLEIFHGFPQSAHATARLVPILGSKNWVPNHFQFTSYPILHAEQPRILAASLNKQKKCTLANLRCVIPIVWYDNKTNVYITSTPFTQNYSSQQKWKKTTLWTT